MFAAYFLSQIHKRQTESETWYLNLEWILARIQPKYEFEYNLNEDKSRENRKPEVIFEKLSKDLKLFHMVRN